MEVKETAQFYGGLGSDTYVFPSSELDNGVTQMLFIIFKKMKKLEFLRSKLEKK